MKRVVFSFPFGIATFLIGIAAFVFANGIYRWMDVVPSFDEPPVRAEERQVSPDCCPPPAEETDVKSIYNVMLSQDLYKSKRIILDEFTERGGTFMDSAVDQGNIEGAQPSTIADYALKNKDARSLRDVLGDRKDIVFITNKDYEALAQDKNTPFEEKFERRFPGSHRVVSLSGVGFDPDHGEALIYVSYYCGSLCAGGSFYVLKKIKNLWTIDRTINMWVS
jgi:hypothetical protein